MYDIVHFLSSAYQKSGNNYKNDNLDWTVFEEAMTFHLLFFQ